MITSSNPSSASNDFDDFDTAAFYNENTQQYIDRNHNLNMSTARSRFIQDVRQAHEGPYRVLDAGSGTGRDTLAFLEEGFEVDAFDASEALAAFSTEQTGVPTQVARFETLTLPPSRYDGIWAMASLLHVKREDLPQVLVALGEGLKDQGVLHAVFKKGDQLEERMGSDGRRFTDMNEAYFSDTLDQLEGWSFERSILDAPLQPQTNPNEWLTFVLRKTGPVSLKSQPRNKFGR